MNNFNDKKQLLSEFNEASYQILRLHDYWVDCAKFSRDGNFDRWKWTLDVIWIELCSDAYKKNEERYKKELLICDTMINKSKNKAQLYYSLKKKQEFLKTLQDDVGKGSKRSEHFEDMM